MYCDVSVSVMVDVSVRLLVSHVRLVRLIVEVELKRTVRVVVSVTYGALVFPDEFLAVDDPEGTT